jgi:class 3 adenylate cyclase/membrane protein implicated in regulation of membrane protease activity
MGIEAIYLLSFVAGVVYALVGGVVTGVLGGHGHHGGPMGHDLHQGMGHGTAALHADSEGEVQLSPISPVTITMFGTAFGGVGLIAFHALALPALFSLPTALVSGFFIAGLAFYAFSKLFQATESSSEAHVTELVGLEAEVITPIPLQGLGEIAYVARGSRFTAPARSEDGKPYSAPSTVLIERIIGNIFCVREPVERDRVLATVLFTDIVGSTEQAATLGDRRWRDLLETHHTLVRRELARFQGREIDTAGDGFLAIFDKPAQAIHCACAVSDAVRQLGIEIRAGLHTGECEAVGDKMRGIAVHIGARVAALATSGEILLSSTVKDLVAGAGIRFEDRGTHVLRGIPGEWRLFAVARSDASGRRASR